MFGQVNLKFDYCKLIWEGQCSAHLLQKSCRPKSMGLSTAYDRTSIFLYAGDRPTAFQAPAGPIPACSPVSCPGEEFAKPEA
jgi:hypothetical protein